MQHVFVRTKLQAFIVAQLIRDGVIRTPFHLIEVSNSKEPDSRPYMAPLRALAGRVTTMERPRSSFLLLFLRFWRLLLVARITRAQVFIANVNWYHLGLALKLVPGMRIRTFDDGTANIQKRSAFYTDEVLDLASLKGRFARQIFPGGVALFTRKRIEQHYSIYPKMQNIVSEDRWTQVLINWQAMIATEDVACLPETVTHILIGTVYAEALKLWSMDLDEEKVRNAIAWADLYIPHPRQPGESPFRATLQKYPAEAIIDLYARKGPISVAHFNSSAVLCFKGNPRIRLIDLAADSSPNALYT